MWRLTSGSHAERIWRPERSPTAVGGTIIAVADIPATPERVFDALSTDEVERWWRAPEYYFQRDWTADLRVAGPWSRGRLA